MCPTSKPIANVPVHELAAAGRWNVHVYPTACRHETRLLKEVRSISESGLFRCVLIVAVKEDDLAERETLGNGRELWRVPLAFGRTGVLSRTLSHLEWNLRILLTLIGRPIGFVNCHSLTALPLAVVLKLFSGSGLIYDTHELETETQRSHGFRRLLAKCIERLLIGFADHVVVVSDSIEGWYRKHYKLKQISTIKNIPYREATVVPGRTGLLRDAFNIGSEDILFLYLGILGPGRGIHLLLKVFANISEAKHILFLGSGTYEQTVKDYAQRYQNIHWHPLVDPADVLRYSADADVGLSLIENICLSYYYCLPNKLFEYLFSGIPVVVSDFPDMARVVDAYDCGWKTELSAPKVTQLISGITRLDIIQKRAGAARCRSELGWEDEQTKLLHLYARDQKHQTLTNRDN